MHSFYRACPTSLIERLTFFSTIRPQLLVTAVLRCCWYFVYLGRPFHEMMEINTQKAWKPQLWAPENAVHCGFLSIEQHFYWVMWISIARWALLDCRPRRFHISDSLATHFCSHALLSQILRLLLPTWNESDGECLELCYLCFFTEFRRLPPSQVGFYCLLCYYRCITKKAKAMV